jgi:hypothetical protein
LDLIKDIESHIEIIFECLDDEISEENILIGQSMSSQDGEIKENDESIEQKSEEETSAIKKPEETIAAAEIDAVE